MEKHFVTFCSPGTIIDEVTIREVDSWNVEKAAQMSLEIIERYGSRPYCFFFTTRSRGENDLDSTETARSGKFYLGGELVTLADLKAENDPQKDILIRNMESNGYEKVVRTKTPYVHYGYIGEKDTILEVNE